MNNTCFVIMPIGTQQIGGHTITEEELKKKYDFIIKEAIKKSNPSLQVLRADEELNPGSISNDIFTKLMHSKYVIADITYPNPNVFYELGIRHAIKPRTILIREKVDFSIPFDISHLRYIEYTQQPDGMSNLSQQLKKQFMFYEKNPDKPDNQFLELCSFTNYTPALFSASEKSKDELSADMFGVILSNPNLLHALIANSPLSDNEKNILNILEQHPSEAKDLLLLMSKAGIITT